jgi:predicted transcriptional regulator
MTEDQKGTTVFLDPETVERADAIAAKLGPLVGGKMSRSAIARRAILELFLRECPSDRTDDVTKDEQVAA